MTVNAQSYICDTACVCVANLCQAIFFEFCCPVERRKDEGGGMGG